MSTRSAARRAADARRRRRGWFLVLAVVSLLALGGILFLPIGDEESSAGVTVTMTEYAYSPAPIRAEAGQEIEVVNAGAIVHNLLITELAKGIELEAGGRGSLRLPADETGTFRVICDLPGHQEAGMVTELIVT